MELAQIAAFATLGVLIIVNLCTFFYYAGKLSSESRQTKESLERQTLINAASHKEFYEGLKAITVKLTRVEEHTNSINGSIASCLMRISELEKIK